MVGNRTLKLKIRGNGREQDLIKTGSIKDAQVREK
jgi:hypothetical protein